jgi:hypothetical protein
MTPHDQALLDALTEHDNRMRREIRKAMADQLRLMRRIKRMTLAEYREYVESSWPTSIPYFVT